jgi:histidinol dehydrogenase
VAEAVRSELRKQVKAISRAKAAKIVIKKGMLLVVVKNLRVGMDLCNQFAPEHLELMVKNPKQWLKKVKAAGAVFVGPWSPEAVGDYVAGPSHVLPTGGSASRFSGLTVEDFRRRMSFIKYTRADLVGSMKVVEAFGKLEGLDAHTKSAMARFEEE